MTVQDFCLHVSTMGQFTKQLFELVSSGKRWRIKITEWRDQRSIPQNSLQHMWYAELSAYLIKRGKPFASPEWVKDAMKHTYLGYEAREMVDVVTGERTQIQTLRHTSCLDTGDMHYYLTQVEGWALNVGCRLTIPADSEYNQLRQKQVA
ncbi:YbcN family protein [Erwinia pyri]|uniref:YbcN family protein n=1 Tax=Erwinia pyri TaxID=3062598 RepID=A0AA50DFR9_9GAMM|nr:YbcN family protein [Erwinia sp. DE2]WLS77374.1 YbcN family protein [Erwinia sp. DE2]